MKAFVLKERGKIGYVEKPLPELRDPHGALLRPVLVSPCTSDVHTIWQGSPKRPNLTLGHECLAVVEAVGGEVQDFHPGETVAVSAITPDWAQPDVMENYGHAGQNFSGHLIGKSIDGAFQECFYLPYADKNLAHIPAGMSREDALMCVDVVQTGFTAAEEGAVKPGQTVVVMGIGAIGLAAILGCKALGASRIFAVGSSPENVRLAEAMSDGHTRVEAVNYKTCQAELPAGMHPLANSTGSPVVNYILSQTGTKGADAVLLCGGNDFSLAQAVDMVKYGTGVVSNVMYFGAEPEMQHWQEEHATLSVRRRSDADLDGEQQTPTGAAVSAAETGLDMKNQQQAGAGLDAEKPALSEAEVGNAGSPTTLSYPAVDGLWIPKFSMGRGMAGKTLKFSLSRGGRENLERVMGIVMEKGMHPGDFITKRYEGLDKIEEAIYDMKRRKAIKIAVKLPFSGKTGA